MAKILSDYFKSRLEECREEEKDSDLFTQLPAKYIFEISNILLGNSLALFKKILSNKTGFNLVISHFNIRGKLSIERCNK